MAKGRGWVRNALYESGAISGAKKFVKSLLSGDLGNNPAKAEEKAYWDRYNKRQIEGVTSGDSISALKKKKALEDLED